MDASTVAAIISLRWNLDGSAIATASEDGSVKVWSRSGMLRSTIATCRTWSCCGGRRCLLFRREWCRSALAAQPVYGVAWGPDNDQVMYASGRELFIKSMQADRKQLNWKAHDGVITAVDWNIVNNLIVTAAEDCKYKVRPSSVALAACVAPAPCRGGLMSNWLPCTRGAGVGQLWPSAVPIGRVRLHRDVCALGAQRRVLRGWLL